MVRINQLRIKGTYMQHYRVNLKYHLSYYIYHHILTKSTACT